MKHLGTLLVIAATFLGSAPHPLAAAPQQVGQERPRVLALIEGVKNLEELERRFGKAEHLRTDGLLLNSNPWGGWCGTGIVDLRFRTLRYSRLSDTFDLDVIVSSAGHILAVLITEK